MPTKPATTTLNAKTPDILNAVRNSASPAYARAVPIADAGNIREVGDAVLGSPIYVNEFLTALINRIGAVLVSSRMYQNPWAMFKKGKLEFGESIEEIFVNLAKANVYDISKSETEVFKREIPDVGSAFHILNYKTFYKTTIEEEQLRQAFLSMSGVTDMVARIVDSMYSAAEYDEFQIMKYCIVKNILNGTVYPVEADGAKETKDYAKKFKAISNQMQFLSDKYNFAGVKTTTPVQDQYLIVTSEFDAAMDIDILAAAFNMDKAEFMGHRILVDSFDNLDFERLAELLPDEMGNDSLGFNEATKERIKNVKAVLVDLNWFMVFDNTEKFTEIYNAQGMYWNYFFHVWKTFSVSPFCNAVYVSGVPITGTGITVTPAQVNVEPGKSVEITAFASGDFMYQGFRWLNSDPSKADMSYKGNTAYVTIKKGAVGASPASENARLGDADIMITAINKYSGASESCSITIGPEPK